MWILFFWGFIILIEIGSLFYWYYFCFVEDKYYRVFLDWQCFFVYVFLYVCLEFIWVYSQQRMGVQIIYDVKFLFFGFIFLGFID